jgi:NAD-dependent DNA ligase
MPSPKLLRILQAKSPFTEEELAKISEKDGWASVYASSEPKKRRRKQGIEICFTGFSLFEKKALSSQAVSAGLKVVGSVTKGLSFLCIGDNPGISKVQKAYEQNVQSLSLQQFTQLVETGELPQVN